MQSITPTIKHMQIEATRDACPTQHIQRSIIINMPEATPSPA
jgi:hypothetical protein